MTREASLYINLHTCTHTYIYVIRSVQLLSCVQLSATPWTAAQQASRPSLTPELAQTHVHRISDANDLILCVPPLLLPSVFPSIRVFSNESILLIKWPKYWSLRFSLIKYICMCKQIYLFIDCATEVTLKRASG